MANTKVSQLPVYTGDTSGSHLVMNDAGNNATYTVSKEILFSGYYADSASFNTRIIAATNEQDLGQYATTSSLNTASASFNAFSSSILTYTSSINNRTGSFVTTSSFNSFTSSVSTFSASFDTRINAITSSATIDTGSLLTTASFNSFTSSYKSGSFTGSFSGSFTGSLLGNVAGTATYSTLVATQNSNTNQDYTFLFVATGSNGYLQTYADATPGVLYNPSTNQLKATGSLFGTASYAITASYWSGSILNATSASYALTASYALNASATVDTGSLTTTASFNAFTASVSLFSASFDTRINAITSSATINTGSLTLTSSFFAYTSSLNAFSASINLFTASINLQTSSLLSFTASINAKTGSFATTGSNNFNGNQTITGSLTVTNNATVISSFVSTNSSSLFLTSGSNLYIDNTGVLVVTGSSYLNNTIISGSLIVTGSITVSGSVINNLTSSYAITASYWSGSILNATSASFSSTASYWSGSILNATSASYAITASYWSGSVNNATSASYALTSSYATSASYASNGGVTQLLAGANISLSPTNGLGQVTITSTGGSGTYYNTSTGSYGSFYDTTTQTNPVANIPRSMSFNTTDITNGVLISGSGSPYNTYIKFTNAGTYNLQFSAQISKTNPGGTDSTWIWLRKNGSDLAQTNTEYDLSQNGQGVAAWNWFVNASAGDYYQIMWSANATDIQLTSYASPSYGPAVPSVILTANRVDTFLSNTGSFSGSFVGTATTASSITPLNQNVTITGSFVQSGSLVSYGPNTLIGNSTITGSITVATGSMTLVSGSITMPNRPAFRITGAGGGKVAVTALTGSYLNVDYQQGSGWDTTTGTFTAPIAGLYQVNVICRTNSNSLGTISQLIVFKNNTGGTTGTPQIMIEYGSNTTMNHTGGSTISKLAVGDTLKMVVAVGEISFDQNDNFSVAYIG